MASNFSMRKVREAVTKALAERGLRPRTLARLAGLGETAIRDILKEMTDDVRLGTLSRIAEVVEMPLVAFAGLRAVPVLGVVGDDARIQAAVTQDHELAPAIYSSAADLIAYHVATRSLEPKLSNGDILYVAAQPLGPREPVDPDLLYVVQLDNGDMLVRRILSRTEDGKSLLSLPAGGHQQEAAIIALRPVLMICPKAAHHMLMRETGRPTVDV
jgi:repressor LexA